MNVKRAPSQSLHLSYSQSQALSFLICQFSLSLSLLTSSLTFFHSDLKSVPAIGRPSSCTNQWHALIIERLTSIGWLGLPKKHTQHTETHTHTHYYLQAHPGDSFWSLNIYCEQHQLCLLLISLHWCHEQISYDKKPPPNIYLYQVLFTHHTI